MTDIILPPKKNVVLDATLMNSVLGCGRFVDLRFNHNFQSRKGKSNSLEVGTLCHKVLEVYGKHIIKGFKRDYSISQGLIAGELYATGCAHCADFSVTDINIPSGNLDSTISLEGTPIPQENSQRTKPQCGHQPQEYPGVKNTPEQSEGHYVGWKYALDTMVQYFEHYKNDHHVLLEVEVVKGKVLYEDDEIRVLWKCKLDAVIDTNQAILPKDYKTQKQKREKLTLNNQFIGQCLNMGTRNVLIDNIGFQKSMKPEEKFTQELMSYSADLLLEWQSETLPYAAYKLVEMQENNYYPPNYVHCQNNYGNCPYIPICKANRDMRQDELRINFEVGPEWNPTNDDSE